MAIGAYEPSDDGNLLAYTADNTGYRQYTLQIKDLRTGKLLPDHVERVDGVEWASDNKTVFYVTEDAVTKRHDKFFRHTVGTDASELFTTEPDEIFDIGVGRTHDREFILLEAASKTSTEVRYLPGGQPDWRRWRFCSRANQITNTAPNMAATCFISGPTRARRISAWSPRPTPIRGKRIGRNSSPTGRSVKIERIEPFANHLVVEEWENGLQQIEVVDLKTQQRQTHPVSGAGVRRGAWAITSFSIRQSCATTTSRW